MTKEKYSLLVDAAYLQICTRESYKSWYKENGRKKPPKLAKTDWFAGFWVTLAGFLHFEQLGGRDYTEGGIPSLYIFDALFDDDRANDWSANVRFLSQEIRERIDERSEWQSFIYEHTLPRLPNGNADEMEAQIEKLRSNPQKSFRDIPDSPGVYLGFLSSDQREPTGVAQKAVDTMLTLCGVLKANEGRNVTVYTNDQDFLPLANYVLRSGRKFNLVNWGIVGGKWNLLRDNAKFDVIEMRPAVADHFKS